MIFEILEMDCMYYINNVLLLQKFMKISLGVLLKTSSQFILKVEFLLYTTIFILLKNCNLLISNYLHFHIIIILVKFETFFLFPEIFVKYFD